MSQTSLITKFLNDPTQLTDAEKNSISEVAKLYPYFVPAHYAKEKLATHTQPTNTRDLYVCNWLLFREFLNEPKTETTQPAPVPTPVAVVEEPVIIPVVPEEENITVEPLKQEEEPVATKEEEQLITPVYTENYFLHQGVQVSDKIPEELDHANDKAEEAIGDKDPKSLMVVMSFSEWLMYFKTKKQKETEEEQEKKALKTMWQKEKLAAALEEESEEIPEEVFKMAVDSISKEDGLVSESLAEIHLRQGKHDKAIDMYRKLSLRNPQKKIYFARKIEEILKNK